MAAFRSKHLGLALCVMLALFTAGPAACTCSHGEESAKVTSECSSHHGSSEHADLDGSADAVGDSCTCSVDERAPSIAPGWQTDHRRAAAGTATGAFRSIPGIGFVAVASFQYSSAAPAENLTYLSTLKSLLPSRAPPRL